MNTIRLLVSLGQYLAQCFVFPTMGENVCKEYQQGSGFVATSEERVDLHHNNGFVMTMSPTYLCLLHIYKYFPKYFYEGSKLYES